MRAKNISYSMEGENRMLRCLDTARVDRMLTMLVGMELFDFCNDAPIYNRKQIFNQYNYFKLLLFEYLSILKKFSNKRKIRVEIERGEKFCAFSS